MNRLRRSELAVPGNNPKMIAKAATSAADLVFCDLEDAVAENEKSDAREEVVRALENLDWGTKTRAVRVNGLDDARSYEDFVVLVEGAGRFLDVVILPKVSSAEEVRWVDRLLGYLETKAGLQRRIGLELLIEGVEGLIHVEEIAKSSPRVEALVFGAGDMSASQGVRVTETLLPGDSYPGDFWHYARCKIVVAARAAKVAAVDSPYTNFNDPEGYRAECLRSYSLGYAGKWAIHPKQIVVANDVFSPSEAEVKNARAVLDAYEEATARGVGAIQIDGVLIDEGIARIMRGVLEVAGHD
ncbi:MAG: CoA ester lyase [Actinobacteria bacterium]|nr:CoA ester lyase [Actinomycetota bacterium]